MNHRLAGFNLLAITLMLWIGSSTTSTARAQSAPHQESDRSNNSNAEFANPERDLTSDPLSDSTASENDWWFLARPGLWIVSMDGDITFGRNPGGAATVSSDTFLDLGDTEPSFVGEAAFGRDRWSVWFDAFDFSTDSAGPAPADFTVNGSTITAGTALTNDFGITTFAARVGYDLFGDLVNPESHDAVDMRLIGLAGLRSLQLGHRLEAPAAPLLFDYDKVQGLIEAGARLVITIDPTDWPDSAGTFDAGVSALAGFGGGSDAGVSTFDIVFTLTWHANDNLGLTLGYRQLDLDLDDDESGSAYAYDGRLAGLFFAGTIRF